MTNDTHRKLAALELVLTGWRKLLRNGEGHMMVCTHCGYEAPHFTYIRNGPNDGRPNTKLVCSKCNTPRWKMRIGA